MGKQDYRDAIEKGRQEINVNSNMTQSRRALRKTAIKKPRKNKRILLPSLFFLFILIPVSLLIYVAFLYEPNDTLPASSSNNEVSMELQTPEAPKVPAASDEEQANEEEKEIAAEQQSNAEEAELQEAAAKEAEAQAQLEKEQAEAERQEKQAEAKRQEEQAEAKRQEEQAEAKRQQEAEQIKQQEKQSAGKTHVVQPGETLYRIAVNAYGASGASAGVEKIKQANGLSSNEISVGATLILP